MTSKQPRHGCVQKLTASRGECVKAGERHAATKAGNRPDTSLHGWPQNLVGTINVGGADERADKLKSLAGLDHNLRAWNGDCIRRIGLSCAVEINQQIVFAGGQLKQPDIDALKGNGIVGFEARRELDQVAGGRVLWFLSA